MKLLFRNNGTKKRDQQWIDELTLEANKRFDQLSPEEQSQHRRAQAISFVYGNLGLAGSDATKEDITKIYDERYGNHDE